MQVKFRVWDCIKQEWNTERFYLSPDGELIDRHTGREQHVAFEGQRRFIPVFWTGRVDKNGREIYEEDVLSWEGYLWLVYYGQEWAEWRIVEPSNSRSHNNLAGYSYDSEVIGNRWENPELLEVKKE